MSTAPIIHIPGLEVKMNLRSIYRDKIQHFQDLWASHHRCLESGNESHTDMVFICPQDKKYLRVSSGMSLL